MLLSLSSSFCLFIGQKKGDNNIVVIAFFFLQHIKKGDYSFFASLSFFLLQRNKEGNDSFFAPLPSSFLL